MRTQKNKSPAKTRRDQKRKMRNSCVECSVDLQDFLPIKMALCPTCNQSRVMAKIMWATARKTLDSSEVCAIDEDATVYHENAFPIHPTINVGNGDVLTRGLNFIHPALSTPIPQILNTRKRSYWLEYIEKLPKRRVRGVIAER